MSADAVPSPHQAIILRKLAASEDNYIFAHQRRVGGEFCGATLYCDRKSQRLGPATLNALIRGGWLNTDAPSRMRISEAGRTLLASLPEAAFVRSEPKVVAADLRDALRARYPEPEWLSFFELRGGTGYQGTSEKRIDAWVINCYPSKHLLKIAYEIKVSRGDFLREMKDPQKRTFAMSVSNEFYFLAPDGLIAIDEIPDDCGLMVLDQNGDLKVLKRAPTRPCASPDWIFVASLARRLHDRPANEPEHTS